jgi:hypothetical protein
MKIVRQTIILLLVLFFASSAVKASPGNNIPTTGSFYGFGMSGSPLTKLEMNVNGSAISGTIFIRGAVPSYTFLYFLGTITDSQGNFSGFFMIRCNFFCRPELLLQQAATLLVEYSAVSSSSP